MKRLVTFMLSLALAGFIGLTAGCKKKEKAPTPETPKTEAPAPEKKAPKKAPVKAEQQKEAPAKEEHK